ncbi:MAG: YfbM family protein [Isosphaeraceae bacterium]
MGCRGVHFALSPEELADLEAAKDDEALMALIEEIEDRWDRDWLVETDKAWDAIHRCLTDGTLEYGPSPLHKCVLGAANRHSGDDYVVNLLGSEEVKEVAEAIREIDEDVMRRAYFAIDPGSYDGDLSEDDFGYTWENFLELRAFFEKAARQVRAVAFTVDQERERRNFSLISTRFLGATGCTQPVCRGSAQEARVEYNPWHPKIDPILSN